MSIKNTVNVPKGKLGEALWTLEDETEDPKNHGITYGKLAKVYFMDRSFL